MNPGFRDFRPIHTALLRTVLCLVVGLCFVLNVNLFAQSSDQNLPTPITANQINGEIKARDIGDSRLTTYYYIFNGNRGDIFINVVTSNLNGDIDIFTAEGIRPKTKITLYADSSENETGRVIYMRKPEKLILRIQGRTPNDDPATFQIKFAGSFAPATGLAQNDALDEPKVVASNNAKVKVNSVGTIIEEPKPTPAISEVKVEEKAKNDETVAEKTVEKVNAEEESKDTTSSGVDSDRDPKKETDTSSTFDPTRKVDDIIKSESKTANPRVLITDPLKDDAKKDDLNTESAKNTESKEREFKVDIKDKPKNTSAIVRIERVEEDDSAVKETKEKANPLANIFLKVELKNGETFQRSMAEVLSMNVIKGVLTIVTSDGKIQEYSILDVAKMTVE